MIEQTHCEAAGTDGHRGVASEHALFSDPSRHFDRDKSLFERGLTLQTHLSLP
jgi:hypothetical protein